MGVLKETGRREKLELKVEGDLLREAKAKCPPEDVRRSMPLCCDPWMFGNSSPGETYIHPFTTPSSYPSG